MKCPTCKDQNLVISERQGIEIDYCPECRGVWLDRGELDKILERSAASLAPQAQAPVPPQAPAAPQPPVYGTRHEDYGHRDGGGYRKDEYRKDEYRKDGYGKYPKRRKSFLE